MLWEGNIFTPVCDSVHMREGCVSQHEVGKEVYIVACNGQPGGVCLWAWVGSGSGRGSASGSVHPQADTPGQTPSWTETPEITIEVGGTHPNGMHSCF